MSNIKREYLNKKNNLMMKIKTKLKKLQNKKSIKERNKWNSNYFYYNI